MRFDVTTREWVDDGEPDDDSDERNRWRWRPDLDDKITEYNGLGQSKPPFQVWLQAQGPSAPAKPHDFSKDPHPRDVAKQRANESRTKGGGANEAVAQYVGTLIEAAAKGDKRATLDDPFPPR